jgi:cytochrome P450
MPDRDAYPVLPGALADKPTLSLADRLRGKRLRMPWAIPDAAFRQPLLKQKSIVGDIFWIGDPALAKHVLVDRAADYPKAALELKLFQALFGQGLLGIDGDLWRKHRRTMAPTFTPGSVASYAADMAASSTAFAERWRDLPEGAVVDVSEAMNALTLTIIARTMFSDDGASAEPAVAEAMSGGSTFNDIGLLDIVPGFAQLRMKARIKRFATIFRPLDDAIARMTTSREASANPPDDLLSQLMAARDAETGAGLSAQEIRDEVVTIFLAGHETTATAMTWIWYLLARQPAEAARLRAELDSVLGGRTPTQADLPQLAYARRFVDEALRILPPTPGISSRVAAKDDELGGMPVRKGAFMLVLPWVMHRNRLVWDEPERFDPDRFLPERSQGRHRLAALPFGAGPRVCIGQLLAVNEILLILATLAQHFELDLASDAPVELLHNITLRPKGGLPMRVRGRDRTLAAVAAE